MNWLKGVEKFPRGRARDRLPNKERPSDGPSAQASAKVAKEGGQVACHQRGCLNWGKVPAARKDRPALDVVYAFQVRARRLAFGNLFVGKDTERRRCVDVCRVDRAPAIIPIVAHRAGDGLRGPVER